MEEWRLRARNEARQLIQVGNRGKSNSINIGANETHDHALLKFEIGFILARKGYEFYTEAILTNGCRPDIYVLDNSECFEIMVSESLEEIENKVRSYPPQLQINPIHSICDAVTIIEGWD